MNYDPQLYRALGVGDTVKPGHYVASETGGEPYPAPHESYGVIVDQDTPFTFLEPLQLPAAMATNAIADSLGLKTDIGRKALVVALSNIQVLDRKQRDYGSGNIAAFGEFGVLVRTWDKISRLRNLLTNVKDPANESVEDSWLDLSNYAIIAVLCRRGEWR